MSAKDIQGEVQVQVHSIEACPMRDRVIRVEKQLNGDVKAATDTGIFIGKTEEALDHISAALKDFKATTAKLEKQVAELSGFKYTVIGISIGAGAVGGVLGSILIPMILAKVTGG